jgi:hypothetical protein
LGLVCFTASSCIAPEAAEILQSGVDCAHSW